MSTMSTWTTPAAIRKLVLKRWDRGEILAELSGAPSILPLRLPLRGPSTEDLSHRFDEARAWIRSLVEASRDALGHGYVVEWEERQLRELGRNRVPKAVRIETVDDALRLIGKEKAAQRFLEIVAATMHRVPELRGWLVKNAHMALENADDWEGVLSVIAWFRDHPRPGVYLRQLDIAGVDTKFIEDRRALCGALLDEILPPEAIADELRGAANFVARYGLRSKPPLVRFRVLDPALRVCGYSDLSVPVAEFRASPPQGDPVFVVENETNCLAFPDVPNAIVIFGQGYAVDLLAGCGWLKDRRVYYWGDVDTHGYAMLDRFRAVVPNTSSLLMDEDTLLAHEHLWVIEPEQHMKPLSRLTAEEHVVYNHLLQHRYGDRVRLEQERVGFGYLERSLAGLTSDEAVL